MEDNAKPAPEQVYTGLSPELTIKRDPFLYHKDDIERVLMDKLPGYIPDISGTGQIPGCRFIEFMDNSVAVKGLPAEHQAHLNKATDWYYKSAVDKVNYFFQAFANYTLRAYFVREQSIVILYSSWLNEEDTNDMQFVSDKIRQEINKIRAERAVEKEKKERDELMKKQAIELIGKKAFDHNLFGKLEEYEKENAKLQEENKKLKQANKQLEAKPKKK